jgi:hypothetical protein
MGIGADDVEELSLDEIGGIHKKKVDSVGEFEGLVEGLSKKG